jgi:hemerythrin-like metal-binding protein
MTSAKQNCCDTKKPPVIESVRQNLIAKIQQLQQAIEQKNEPSQIMTTIDELKYQSVYYFTQKEKLMILSGDISYHHHRQEHDCFIWKISDMQDGIESNHYQKVLEICKELQKWLYDHKTASGQEFKQTHFRKDQYDPAVSC